MEFSLFKTAVAKQFALLAAHHMFRTNVSKDDLWTTYLASFPKGSNPIYKERTEHDCQCCKGFIRAVGNAVAVIDGKLVSVWDCSVGDPNYQAVADALAAFVKAQPIADTFLHYEGTAGTDRSLVDTLNGVQTWNHFFVNLKLTHVMREKDIGGALNETRGDHDVLLRSLQEFSLDSVDTVLELIAQKSLYRGEEHEPTLTTFRKLKVDFDKLPADKQDWFAWVKSVSAPGPVKRLRNTALGTLLQDLAADVDLEGAVKKFEAVMAPANYKRSTALVTKAMIEKAKAAITELGYTSALERRYAVLEDISINNVLFANRSTRKSLNADVFDDLAAGIADKKPKSLDRVAEIHIDKFLSDILPDVDSIELFLENRHQANLVSLIAPTDATAKLMFKWANPFSWSYSGDLADSEIRKAVAGRGGRVDGVFRFSHSWNYDKRNASLMDLHVFMPGSHATAANGIHDNYGNNARVGWNHRSHDRSGGVQDVDYVQAAPVGYVPVENITFPDLHRMPEGEYVCKIHNWNLREPTQGGFKAEIEFGGQVFEYEHRRPLKNKEWVTVAVVTLKNGQFTIDHHLPPSTAVRNVWSLATQSYVPVNVVMLSPNYWDDAKVGNKHYFFMLEGCANEGTARGFFNEFLNEALTPHRKTMEMVGSKLKAESSDRQLSGLGFSSTQRNSVLCRVKGKFSRIINLTF